MRACLGGRGCCAGGRRFWYVGSTWVVGCPCFASDRAVGSPGLRVRVFVRKLLDFEWAVAFVLCWHFSLLSCFVSDMSVLPGCTQASPPTSNASSLPGSSWRMAAPWPTTTSRRSPPSTWCCACVVACRFSSRP